jgi:hypothetical protein
MVIALLNIANRSSSLEERHVRKRQHRLWLVEFADESETSTSPRLMRQNTHSKYERTRRLEDAMRSYGHAWLSLETTEALQ